LGEVHDLDRPQCDTGNFMSQITQLITFVPGRLVISSD